DLTEDWEGLIIILDTSSALAEIINAKRPGRYAIKVR
ncbi:MAG: DNA-binding protein, partial [Candidatus Methanomethylicota archaeon]